MRCNKAREYISDALDERLDEVRGLELSTHLGGCPDCLQHQSLLERARPLLQQDLVEPSENFEWKVQLKIQQALREKAAPAETAAGWRFWRPALASATSVAAVVLIAGGLIFLSHTALGFSLDWLEVWWPTIPVLFGIYLVVRSMQENAAAASE